MREIAKTDITNASQRVDLIGAHCLASRHDSWHARKEQVNEAWHVAVGIYVKLHRLHSSGP